MTVTFKYWVDFHFLPLPHVPLRGQQTGAQSPRLGIQLSEKPRKLTPEEVFAEIDQMPLGSVEISRVHVVGRQGSLKQNVVSIQSEVSEGGKTLVAM